MTTSTQSVIKIGDSMGVTLPAKELKRLGVKLGDSLRVSFELVESSAADEHSVEVVELTQKLIARHQKALENLSQR